MQVVVTGVAGFIGFHVANALLARGDSVIGIDNLNPYYDVSLKESRLKLLEAQDGFTFHRADIADRDVFISLRAQHPDVKHVVHLAAQAGVRHSLNAPDDYVHSNLSGHLQVLEYCRSIQGFEHLVYASSSSVYGGNDKVPFAESDAVDLPLSLYGATKRADELMTQSYSHLFAIPATGLRFFTVYGPYGRPDMAYYTFTQALFAGEPITLFNHGKMQRDFTYIDDIVAEVVAALDSPPNAGESAPHQLFNLGNNKPEDLETFVRTLELATGQKADIHYDDLQAGDAVSTYADIDQAAEKLGFTPQTTLKNGISYFVSWFREYHGVS